MAGKSLLKRVDWLTVLIYLALLTIGWVNIYSSTFSDTDVSIFDFSTLHGKQFFFIGASLTSIVLVLALEASFYERFSSLLYIIAMVLLLGLFVFGKTIAGATSWYNLGFFNLQPSEFAKVATALALAKYLSDIQTDLKRRKDQWYAFLVLLIPAVLIIPQPDPGSALVFFAMAFVIFREGLPLYYLSIVLLAILVFVTTLMFGTIWVGIVLVLLIILFLLLKKKTFKAPIFPMVSVVVIAILFSLSVNFVFNNVGYRYEQMFASQFDLQISRLSSV